MQKSVLTHTGAEIDEAVRLFQQSLLPTGTLPAQVILHANCNPVNPSVILSWQWQDGNATGIVIRRKKDSAPVNVYDGDAVCDITDKTVKSFTDTNFQTSVGTIDRPAVYYYRAFPYNENQQYQTQYQTSIELGMDIINVYYLPDGSVLGDIGETNLLNMPLVFGRYGLNDDNVKDMLWQVVHVDVDAQLAYLMFNDAPWGNMMFDNNEPTWPDSVRRSNGNSRWAFSNIRQLLNGTASFDGWDSWYSAQHEYDAPPNYVNSYPGFLHYFTEAERNLIVPRQHTLFVPTVDGGGTETVIDKVWLPTTMDLGLETNTKEGEFCFEALKRTNASRAWQYNYWTSTIYQHTSPTHLWGVSSGGALSYNNYVASYTGYFSARAGLVLPLSSLVQYNTDKERYHVITAKI